MSMPAHFALLTGKIVGRYHLERVLDAHQWGPIFLGSNQMRNRFIIRFIGAAPLEQGRKVTPAEQRIITDRLQQEARKLAQLSHPHLIPLLDYGTYQGLLYLVYPSLTSPSLRSLLAPNILSSPFSLGRFLEQIASALEYAHAQGVLHRNLSTSTLFLRDSKQIVLGELGLLHLWELSCSGVPQTSGRIWQYEGSTESCAPEQILRRPSGVYTDVYALGAVLYRMLTGYAPFTGQTREERMQQHLYASIPLLKTRRDGLPLEFDSLIAKAMAKEPVQRFKDPSALVEAYSQVVAYEQKRQFSLSTGRGISNTMPISSHTMSMLPHQQDANRQLPETGSQKESSVSRRRFVAITGVGAGIVIVASTGIFGSRLLHEHTSSALSVPPENTGTTTLNKRMNNGNVLAKVADVPTNNALQFPLSPDQNPGILIHLPSKQFVAFDSTCTHEGCAVYYNMLNHLLICPCHDAMFDPAKNGAVVQGPATKPLVPLKVSVQPDGTILLSS
jgi:serine/threonine protein kinase